MGKPSQGDLCSEIVFALHTPGSRLTEHMQSADGQSPDKQKKIKSDRMCFPKFVIPNRHLLLIGTPQKETNRSNRSNRNY